MYIYIYIYLFAYICLYIYIYIYIYMYTYIYVYIHICTSNVYNYINIHTALGARALLEDVHGLLQLRVR